MILATNWAVVGSLIGAVIAGVFGTIAAVIADRRAKSATKSEQTTKTIEIGITELINQYRQANEELRDEVHEVTAMKDRLESDMARLRAELTVAKKMMEEMVTEKDNLEAEIIRLKLKCGEIS